MSPPAEPANEQGTESPVPTIQPTFSSTPVGTSSQYPTNALKRIASQAGTSASALATLTVTSTTTTLYHAILEYAAYRDAPAPSSDAAPLLADALFVTPEDAFAPADDASGEEEDQTPSNRLERAVFRRRQRRGRGRSALPRPGRGRGTRVAQPPKVKHALGEAKFLWPPLPHLAGTQVGAHVRHAWQTYKRRVCATASAAASSAPGDACGEGGGSSGADPLANAEPDAGAYPNSHEGSASDAAAQKRNSHEDSASDATAQKPNSHEDSANDATAQKRFEIYMVHYTLGQPKPVSFNSFVTYREVLLATTEPPSALHAFTKEVMQWRLDKDYRASGSGRYALHRFKTTRCGNGKWVDEGMKRARPEGSVVLPDGQLEAIMDDVERFMQPEAKRWCREHGLPHRRSFLFYGPPGTGKTSTIRAIASKFGLNCCFLGMTDSKFSNQNLGDALSKIPPNALLVLEDVDALFNENRKSATTPSLTFSGLLNALDGVISADGVLTAMTTNHIERLDKALVRGGRVDRRFLFELPSQKVLQKLFKLFYPDAAQELAKQFAEAIFSRSEGDEARSIATLQQLFVQHRENSAEECLAGISSFFKAHFPDGTADQKGQLYF